MTKKKIKNKVVCILVVMVTLVNIQPIWAYANETANIGENCGDMVKEYYVLDKEGVEDIDAQDEKENEIIDSIMELMCLHGNEYLDYYAGAYVSENDVPILCVNKDNYEIRNYIESNLDESVEIRVVKNSYNDLLNIKDILEENYIKLYNVYGRENQRYSELVSSILGFEIDEIENKIIVSLKDLDKQKEKLFNELFGFSEYVILKNQEIYYDKATWKPGRGIYIKMKSGNNYIYGKLSTGFKAEYSNSVAKMVGYVTAGHGTKDTVDNCVYSSDSANSEVVGRLLLNSYNKGVDASFFYIYYVRNGKTYYVNKKYDIASNQVQYTNNQGGESVKSDKIEPYVYVSSVSQGNVVIKNGATTYRTTAKVKSNNCSVTTDGIVFKNLVKTQVFSQSGDSGAIVYIEKNGRYYVCGIIKGGSFLSDMYTPCTQIYSTLGVR